MSEMWPVLVIGALFLVWLLTPPVPQRGEHHIDDRCGNGDIEDRWGLDALDRAAHLQRLRAKARRSTRRPLRNRSRRSARRVAPEK